MKGTAILAVLISLALFSVAARAEDILESTTVKKRAAKSTSSKTRGGKKVSRSDGTSSETSFEIQSDGNTVSESIEQVVHAHSTCSDRKLNLAWLSPITTDQRSLDLSGSMKQALRELQDKVSEEYYRQFGVKIITYDLSVTWNGESTLVPDIGPDGDLLPYKTEPNAFKIRVSDSDDCVLDLNVPVRITDVNECEEGGYKAQANCEPLVSLAAPTIWESMERKKMENCLADRCSPINVCQEGTDTCSRFDVSMKTGPATCIHLDQHERDNHEGETYLCRCTPGYEDIAGANAPESERGRTCIDIDECALGEHSCNEHATCVNTMGSYTCQCPRGWNTYNDGHGPDGCRLPEEVPPDHDCPCRAEVCDPRDTDCHFHPAEHCRDVPIRCFCPDGATCKNGQCVCEPGYTLRDGKCVDYDECSAKTHKCSRLGQCINLEGGYKCVCDADIGGSCITDTPHCLFEGASISLPQTEATIYQYDIAPDVGSAELVVGTKDKVSSFGSGGDIGLHFKIDFKEALEMAPPSPDRVYFPGDYVAKYTITYKQCDPEEQKGTTRVCMYNLEDGTDECADRPVVTVAYEEKVQTKNFTLHVLPRNECKEKTAVWAAACTSTEMGGVCTDTENAYKCRCDPSKGWEGNGFQSDFALSSRPPEFHHDLWPRIAPMTNLSEADAATGGERNCRDVQAPVMSLITPSVPIRRCRCGSLVETIQVPADRALCSNPVPLPPNVVVHDIVPQNAVSTMCGDIEAPPREAAAVTHVCFRVVDNDPTTPIEVTRRATHVTDSNGALESVIIAYDVVDGSGNAATFTRTVSFIDYDVKTITEEVRDMLILAGFVAPLAAILVLLVWNFYPIVMMFRIFIGLPPNDHQSFEAGALLAERLMHPFRPVSEHHQAADTKWHAYLDSLQDSEDSIGSDSEAEHEYFEEVMEEIEEEA